MAAAGMSELSAAPPHPSYRRPRQARRSQGGHSRDCACLTEQSQHGPPKRVNRNDVEERETIEEQRLDNGRFRSSVNM